MRGNCYVVSEALYHILGGKRAGWKPMRMKVRGETHWFLKHTSGLRIDASRLQFGTAAALLDYSNERGSGFLTRMPSKRARNMIRAMTWQEV